MENSGFSFANGSGRTFFVLSKPAGGVVRPPVYSGIVPSLLPALSAPTRVRVVPSLLASSAVTAACNAPACAASTAATINALVSLFMFSTVSERGFECQIDRAAIRDGPVARDDGDRSCRRVLGRLAPVV